MKIVVASAALALLFVGSSQAQTAVEYWTPRAVQLPQFWDSGTQPVSLPSPDGKFVLRVTGKRTGKHYPAEAEVPDYYVVSNGKRLTPAIRAYTTPSALWSPSSELLAVQSSDGGGVGNWKVYVYSFVGNLVVEHNVMRNVHQDLASRFPAGINPSGQRYFSRTNRQKFAQDTTWVNVYSCGWIAHPDRLLVSAGVPGSSRYGENMGRTLVYTIDPRSGRILRRYTEEQAKQLWSQCVQ
jgi:hypothetical protein